MGSLPPEESMRILDQITPVEICTEATFPRAMLSSLLPNMRDFTLRTCCGVTIIRTGKNRLPLVPRLAVKVWELGRFGIWESGYSDSGIVEKDDRNCLAGRTRHPSRYG